jgi:hypothetical protein
MADLSAVFLSWQVLLIGIVVFLLLRLARRVPKLKDCRVFTAGLPVWPYALGMGCVMLPGVPLPSMISTVTAKLMYGLYSGWLSGFSYQLVRHILETKGGLAAEGKDESDG